MNRLIHYAARDAELTLELARAMPDLGPMYEDPEPLIAHGAGPGAPRRKRHNGYTKENT